MLKKTLTYQTPFGDNITEDFYFNLTKSEIVDLEVSVPGGLKTHLEKVVGTSDGGEVIRLFQDLLRRSYGKRSDDGKRFVKSDEFWTEFTETGAYDALFMQLVTNAENAADFVSSIVPKDMAEIAAKAARGEDIEDDRPAWVKEDREPTRRELVTMTQDQLREAMSKKLAD